jgi:hypothetical protein
MFKSTYMKNKTKQIVCLTCNKTPVYLHVYTDGFMQ